MNFSRILITTAAASLIATAPASASTASVSVSVPDTLTTTIAKNFTRSSIPKDWTVGGCRKVSSKVARCSAYDTQDVRSVATVSLLEDRLTIAFS